MYFPLIPTDSRQARGALLNALMRIREICDTLGITMPDDLPEKLGRIRNRAALEGDCIHVDDIPAAVAMPDILVEYFTGASARDPLHRSLQIEAALLCGRVALYARMAVELPAPPAPPEHSVANTGG